MTVKHDLATLAAAGVQAWTRVAGAGDGQFQIVILHDIAEDQYDALRSFLDFVEREHGFITPSEAEALLSTEPSRQNGRGLPCLLSFDDGFRSAGQVARRILPYYQAKALFFICPGLVDLPRERQGASIVANVLGGRPPGRACPDLMTWPEITELQKDGHVVGAHGSMHLKLSEVDDAIATREILCARDRLGEQLGHAPSWYAYAFGDIGAISAQALRTILHQFKYCRSGVRGSNGRRNSHGILMAQEIDLDAPTRYHRAILHGGLDIRYLAARRRLRQYAAKAAL